MELRCTYDPDTRGGDAPDGRKVKATLHWVAERQASPPGAALRSPVCETDPDDVEEGRIWSDNLNPDSLEVTDCCVEPSVAARAGHRYQFERQGYFCVDTDSTGRNLVFDRTVTLRDSWAKIEKAMKGSSR